MPDGGVRLYLAPNDPMLDATVTWEQVDSSVIAGVSIQRGKQDEFNRTGTGTATIRVNDTAGLFDTTNSGSVYFDELDGIQARIDLYDPVANDWETIFQGFTDTTATDA